jgi:hypothetical protein
MQTNPRKGGTYFDTSLLSQENLGEFGNAKRRFFSGPRAQQLEYGSGQEYAVERVDVAGAQGRVLQHFQITRSLKRRVD